LLNENEFKIVQEGGNLFVYRMMLLADVVATFAE
jgi:hypothetical protein